MADVFLGSVYAKIELRNDSLDRSLKAAQRQLSGMNSSLERNAGVGVTSAAKISAAYGAIAGVVQGVTMKAIDSLTASISGGIRRFDTMKSYPKVMANLGYSAEESAKSIKTMADKAQGLPTALNDLAATTKSLAPFSRSLSEATDLSIALNDAFLAAGSSAADTSRGMIQFTQMLSKGKVDMGAWNTLQETMGSSLQQVAKKLGIASGNTMELYESLKTGKIRFQQFTDAILELDKKGVNGLKNFRDQAFDATGGIQTMLDNLKNAMNRFWENLFNKIGSENFARGMKIITNAIADFGSIMGEVITAVMPYMERLLNFLSNNRGLVKNGMIAFLGAFVAMKALKPVIGIVKSAAGVLSIFSKSAKVAAVTSKIGGGGGGLIAGFLKPLGDTKVLKGAASVGLVSAGLVAMAFALGQVSSLNLNMKNLLVMAAAVPITAGIFSLIGKVGASASIGGAAVGIIGLGLMSIAHGLTAASEQAERIKIGNLAKMGAIIGIVSTVMAAISGLAVFGAVGSIASAIIGGGLLVTAISLSKISEYVPKINHEDIKKLYKTVAAVSVVLGVISGFSIFGAIGSIANTVMSGGLLVTAIALVEVSKHVDNIKNDKITKLSGTVAIIATVLGLISGLSIFGAVGSIANTIIAGGLVVTTIALVDISSRVDNIDTGKLDKLLGVIAQVNLILASISALSIFAAIGSIVNTVITGGIVLASKALVVASGYAKQLRPEDMEKLKDMLRKISELETGGILHNLKNMVNSGVMVATVNMVQSIAKSLTETQPADDKVIDSLKKNLKNLAGLQTEGVIKSLKDMWASGNLAQVASNIRNIVRDLSGITPPSNDAIDGLKAAIANLSKIDIQGNKLFQNRGKAAEDLAFIIWKMRDIANNMSGIPQVDGGKVQSLIDSLKRFDGFKDEHSAGIRRLAGLGDAIGNINWVKFIFGDVPEGIADGAGRIVSAVQKFSGITEDARSGALRMATMRDSLGNINWIKFILGDVPGDLEAKAAGLVNSINKFNEINVDAGKINAAASAIANLANTVKTNIQNLSGDFNAIGGGMMDNLINGINSRADAARGAGVNVQSAVWGAIQGKLNDHFYQGAALAGKFAEGLRSRDGELQAAGGSMQSAVWHGIEPRLVHHYYQGAALAGQLLNGISSRNGEFYGVGANAVQGFINGANSKSAYSTGWNIAAQFLQGLKAKGQEGSPWRTTFQSGAWAGEGFANGIMRTKSMVKDAAETIADVAMGGMHMDNFNRMVVTPDMSALSQATVKMNASIDSKNVDRPNEVAIYGGVTINTKADDGESILEELARATILSDKGMATAL